MKRIFVLFLVAAAAVGALYSYHPDETSYVASVVAGAAQKAWSGVESNPAPVIFAFGTFLLTVMYYKAKGKSLRESVEAAATRVTVVTAPSLPPEESEHAVLKRAKARSMRSQLLADRIGLENRQRKWPDEVNKAEKETCYTEQAVADAQRTLSERQKSHDQAVAKLKALRKEKAQGEAELAEIDAELGKLSQLV